MLSYLRVYGVILTKKLTKTGICNDKALSFVAHGWTFALRNSFDLTVLISYLLTARIWLNEGAKIPNTIRWYDRPITSIRPVLSRTACGSKFHGGSDDRVLDACGSIVVSVRQMRVQWAACRLGPRRATLWAVISWMRNLMKVLVYQALRDLLAILPRQIAILDRLQRPDDLMQVYWPFGSDHG